MTRSLRNAGFQRIISVFVCWMAQRSDIAIFASVTMIRHMWVGTSDTELMRPIADTIMLQLPVHCCSGKLQSIGWIM